MRRSLNSQSTESAGRSIIQISIFTITVTVELSFEFGYETTSSYTVFQENEVSQEVEIAPNTAGCLWQKTTRFTLMRNKNSWEDVAGSNQVITIDSFVKSEYPN